MSAPTPQPQITAPATVESSASRGGARLSAFVEAAYILEAVRR
jgi:hypothetical protein